MVKKVAVTFVVALLAVFIGVAACAKDKKYEKKITKDQVPQSVITAFEKAYPNVTVTGYEQRTREDKVWYSIEYLDGTITKQVRYAPDGTLLGSREDITAKDLPEAVSKAISEHYPGATVLKAETEVHNGIVQYEVKLDVKGEHQEVTFTDKGEIVKRSEH